MPGSRMRQLAATLALAVLLSGCAGTPAPPPPQPSNEPMPPVPELVIGTSYRVTALDPGAPNSPVGDLVALDVFQRLMVAWPDGSLRPDAAQDCAFRQIQLYECTLKKGLKFHDGTDLTSADVKFSIDRALKLGAPGIGNLRALTEIVTPTPQTVQFRLGWSDSDFGLFLAMPSVSIVPASSYDADRLRPVTGLPIGSGPFRVASLNPYFLRFAKNADYQGATPARTEEVRLRFLDGVAAGEQALQNESVDILWQTLDRPAIERISRIPLASPAEGSVKEIKYAAKGVSGSRIFRVWWNPKSKPSPEIRQALSVAWQRKRTLLSLIPGGTTGYSPVFAGGGDPPAPAATGTLRLSYAAGVPDAADRAWALAAEARRFSHLTVEVVRDDPSADLFLTESLPPINTASAWLRHFVDHSSDPEATKALEVEARATLDPKARAEITDRLSRLAATQAVVLPVSQEDVSIFVRSGVSYDSGAVGPGGQFVLWGVHR